MINTELQPGAPTISVVMAVYNGERFLPEAIDSILNQTFTDFEFIIINDGSTDNTQQILTEYAARDARIMLIRNEKNFCISRSVNKGLVQARGKYVARLDADDVSLPERLARQVDFLEAHPEIGIVGGYMQWIDSEGNLASTIWQRPTDHGLLKWLLCFENPIMNSTVLIRRELLEWANGYNPELDYSEDYDLWQRLSGLTRLANLPELFAYHRRDENYSTHVSSLYDNRQYHSTLKISQRMLSEILGEKVPSKLMKYIIKPYWGKPKFETTDDIYAVAEIIYRLCQAFLRDATLSTAEKQLIRQDAAGQLYRLSRLRPDTFRAWKILGRACRLDPPLVGRMATRLTRRLARYLPKNSGQTKPV